MNRGYARVSTVEQNLDMQIRALTAAGVVMSEIYTDRTSGSGLADTRPGFAQLRQALQSGDALVVWKLDRLGRSLRDMLDIFATLADRDVRIVSITEAIDTRSSAGKLTMQIFAALAEFERGMIRERVSAGMAAAKARGERVGRPASLSPVQVAMIRALDRDQYSVAEMARIMECGRSTIRAALDRLPPYAAEVESHLDAL